MRSDRVILFDLGGVLVEARGREALQAMLPPGLAELFDAVFASHLTGLMKPECEAFEHAVRELGVRPEAVCYFDDLPQNVEAACATGIRAFRVESLPEIERALRAEGLWS